MTNAPVPGLWYAGDPAGHRLVAPGRPDLADDGLMPAYPGPPDPALWVPNDEQFDLTVDQGWDYTTGPRTIDQTVNDRAHCVFGAGPYEDAMAITVTYDPATGIYRSADMMGKFLSLPAEHIVEWYGSMGPLGSGPFPALWERPLSGDGEIDWFEWKGKFGGPDPGSNDRIATNVITTLNGSYTNSKQSPRSFGDVLDARGIDERSWHHYRGELTATGVNLKVDGILVASIVRGAANTVNTITNAEWDRCFTGHPWYFRTTYQFGVGTTGDAGGTPDPSLCPTTMYIRGLNVWKRKP